MAWVYGLVAALGALTMLVSGYLALSIIVLSEACRLEQEEMVRLAAEKKGSWFG